MKSKSLVLLVAATVLFTVSAAHAEDAEVRPTGKFGGAARELRNQNQEQRKNLLDQNKILRENEREENKASREAVAQENKEQRATFEADVKTRLEGLTDAEKKALMPTIQSERKALVGQNKTERQAAIQAGWDSKKNLNDNIRTNMDAFRLSVRTRWTNLWSSFFSK